GRDEALPSTQIQIVLDRPIEVENPPVALEVPRVDALGVFVEQSEDIDVGQSGPPRGPLPLHDALDQALVEPPSVLDVCVRVAVGGPAHLADCDGHGPEAVLLQSGHEGVEIGLHDVVVGDGAVDDGVGRAAEEGVLLGEVGVGLEAEERVDVDGEGAAIVAEELDDGEHEGVDVGSEVSARWKAALGLVDVGV
ncbi:hypothetical protein PanWU01x14_230080, partial [Parasponia andersonii]